jgi:hypothetical protein
LDHKLAQRVWHKAGKTFKGRCECFLELKDINTIVKDFHNGSRIWSGCGAADPVMIKLFSFAFHRLHAGTEDSGFSNDVINLITSLWRIGPESHWSEDGEPAAPVVEEIKSDVVAGC